MGRFARTVATLMLLAVQIGSRSAFAQATDPVEVVKAYVATANTGDFDATFAFYAENAVVRNPLGLFTGKEQIGTWLRQDVQGTRAMPRDYQANGNTVINTGTVSLARFKALGIEQVEYRSEYLIEGGKIRFFSPTVLLTPEQQALVSVGSPAPTPPPVDPVEVVRNYINTANTGDFEATFAFYADGAVVKNPLGLFVGKEEIGTWLRQDVQGTRAAPSEFQVVNGGTTVINTGMVTLARLKALGIDQVAYRSDYLIEGDKIKYFSPTVLLTPEQQERVRAGTPPAAPAPAPAAPQPAVPMPAALPETGSHGALDGLRLAALLGAALLALGWTVRRRTAQL